MHEGRVARLCLFFLHQRLAGTPPPSCDSAAYRINLPEYSHTDRRQYKKGGDIVRGTAGGAWGLGEQGERHHDATGTAADTTASD